ETFGAQPAAAVVRPHRPRGPGDLPPARRGFDGAEARGGRPRGLRGDQPALDPDRLPPPRALRPGRLPSPTARVAARRHGRLGVAVPLDRHLDVAPPRARRGTLAVDRDPFLLP